MVSEYLRLLGDGAHWAFEATATVVVDVLLLGVAWPFIKRAVRRHDREHH